LNTIASPAARLPGPLVTLVRSRTVAKVDSMGLLVFQVHPVLGGEIVEGQQLLGVIHDFRHRLGVLGAEQVRKHCDRLLGVLAVLGVADLRQGLARRRMRRLRQCI
jgi:hypothetical protein